MPIRRPSRSLDWHEPEPWIATLLLVLLVVVLGRHPLARLFGTEVPGAGSATIAAPGLRGGIDPLVTASPRTLREAPLPQTRPAPSHAPVDPFRSLVTTNGGLRGSAVLPNDTMTSSGSSGRGSGHAAATANGSCAASYVVHRGDTLWGLAQKFAGKTGHASWQQLYAANRAAVGSDPSLLQVGTKLCLSK